nr:MAG TPA: hypothetical protein [Caudoviricetes sp.]
MVVKHFYKDFNFFSNLRLSLITVKVIKLSLSVFKQKCYN